MNILNSIRNFLSSGASNNIKPSEPSLKTFESYLKRNNCEYKNLNPESNEPFVTFTYQGGYFVVQASRENNSFILMYRNILNAPADMLDTIRELCNYSNSIAFQESVSYEYDKEENDYSVSINIGGFIEHSAPRSFDYITACINRCFRVANKIRAKYESMTQNGDSDESAINQKEREQFLLREFETSLVEAPFTDLSKKELTIQTFFEDIICTHEIDIEQLDISFPDKAETLHFTDLKEIHEIELTKLIVDKSNGDENATLTKGATITIHYKNICDPENEAHIFLINLLPDAATEFKLYYRMTICDTASRPSRHQTQGNPSREPFVNSLLLAFDKKTDRQKEQEFSFMYKDALDKVNENKYNELTPEQRLIVEVKMDDCSYNLYWGYKYYLDNRYIEALMQLNNVFNTNYTSFLQLNKRSQHTFYEVCYILGMCYYKIGLYNHAHYYIEMASTSRDIKHIRAYIDLLINTYDFRAINLIENAISFLSKEYDLDDDASSEILEGVRALVHCKVQYYVNFCDYSEALNVLDQLSKDPNEKEYVDEQREIIKRLQNE